MDKKPGKPPLYIPRPMELAGMRSRLLRAREQEKTLAATGKEYDEVQDGIDEATDALKGHVGDLKSYHGDLRSTIERMLERSNGDPTDGESDGRQLSSDGEKKEIIVVEPEDVDTLDQEETSGEKPVEKVLAEPAASWGGKPA